MGSCPKCNYDYGEDVKDQLCSNCLSEEVTEALINEEPYYIEDNGVLYNMGWSNEDMF